jgi:DNA mismatch endonuclease (patch repair protein)
MSTGLAKMQRNVARDDHVNEALRAAGWIVLRFWESDVRKRMPVIVRSVARCVGRRRQRLR